MTSLSRQAELRAPFAGILDRIRMRAIEREHDRSLPYSDVRLLAEAGFGSLRLPAREGGAGASLTDVFALLVELAAADSNLPQIWRNHIAFVEDRLQPEPAGQNAHWRRRLSGGAVVGGAWSEPGNASFTNGDTTLARADGRWVLDGIKYYSTGSIFSDWISVAAQRGGRPDRVIAIIAARAPGVTIEDDWTGFGQRTTGSGTTRLAGVTVDDLAIYDFRQRAPYREAVAQLVHLATLAGIARAAQRDVVAHLRARVRAYPHGLTDVPREDAQLQAVVGRVAALASGVEASVLRAAGFLDHAAQAAVDGDPDDPAVTEAAHEAAVAVYEAQITTTDDTLTATTLLFDALGASAVDTPAALDRHWRNARTITSHNPRVYKERLVGAWHLNGTAPVMFDAAQDRPRQAIAVP